MYPQFESGSLRIRKVLMEYIAPQAYPFILILVVLAIVLLIAGLITALTSLGTKSDETKDSVYKCPGCGAEFESSVPQMCGFCSYQFDAHINS